RARLATWGRWVSSARSRAGAGWGLPLTPAAQPSPPLGPAPRLCAPHLAGRSLALAAGLCALTLPWLLPGCGQPGALDVKQHTGSDTGVALNPFVSLRTRLTAQEDVPMFRARTTQRERWRLMVYDRFDGTDFAPSSDPRANLVAFQGPTPGGPGPGPAGDPGPPAGRDPGAGLVLAAGGDHPGPGRGRPAGAGQPDLRQPPHQPEAAQGGQPHGRFPRPPTRGG